MSCILVAPPLSVILIIKSSLFTSSVRASFSMILRFHYESVFLGSKFSVSLSVASMKMITF